MTTTTSTSRRSSSSGPTVHIRCSTRPDGDFHRVDVPDDVLEVRRRSFVDLPWTMLDEHHGVVARRVTTPGEHDGATGDVLVTDRTGAVLGVWAADCAPVVLVGAAHGLAVAHAGWRGLAAGVLDVAADALAEPIDRVVLGPTIGPCCYEFGHADLRSVADGVGIPEDRVTARTSTGSLALDVPGAVAAFADRVGAGLGRVGACTGCSFPGFSHRVRRDPQRHVLAAWQEAT